MAMRESGASRGRAWRIAARACTLGLLLGAQPDRSDDPPASRPHQVLTVERVVVHDGVRNRDIPLKIYYPDGEGPFPVVVFSHGALASKDAYAGLGRYWASFGYVSVHPSHADSIADGGFSGTLRQAIGDPGAWENRPRDVSFVLDALRDVARFAPQLAGKLDLHRIGVAGHSFGAYTAALVGGATVHVPGKQGPQRFADRRVAAVVLLSPQGAGIMGLTADSWDDLRLPVLVMYGSRDFGPFGEPPAWRNEVFRRAPPGDKYDVELAGASHMQFAGSLAAAGAPPDRLFRCVEVETLAFWDAYLKADPDARRYLASNGGAGCGADAGRFEVR